MAKAATLDDPTLAFLHSHGIRVSPRELDVMVEHAVGRLHRTLHRADPRAELTAAEVEVLRRGGFAVAPRDLGVSDPLAKTTAEYAALLKGSLSTAEAAARLGVDASRIRQRLTAQPPTLYGVRLEAAWVVPEFQFDGDALVPGIGEVVARLDPELHPVAVFNWFTRPNPDLVAESLDGRSLSPRDWLRLGLPVPPVAELAAGL